MTEKTAEQYEVQVARMNGIIKNMASSKADDAILIAELRAIVSEQEQLLQKNVEENNALKSTIVDAAAKGREEKDETTAD